MSARSAARRSAYSMPVAPGWLVAIDDNCSMKATVDPSGLKATLSQVADQPPRYQG